MSSLRRAAALAATLLLVSAGARAAGGALEQIRSTPAFGASVDQLLAASREIAGPDAEQVVVLYSETEVQFDERGASTLSERLVYRIPSTDDLGDWGVASVSWQPWHQQRPELRARVIRPDGVELDLDPALLGERSVGGDGVEMFTDDRVLEAPLPGLVAGAVIEEVTRVRDESPYFAAGEVAIHHLPTGARVLSGRLTLDAPRTLPLAWRVGGGVEVDATERRIGGRRTVVFEYGPVEPLLEVEEDLPGDVQPWPWIRFGTGRSWREVARAYADIVDEAIRRAESPVGFDDPGPGAEEPAGRIARIVGNLRSEIRYTGLELGAGGLVPRPPDVTLARSFGDCKDQAVLLVALLRAAGIPADVALLSTGPGFDVDPELPGLGEFDHAIVRVRSEPPTWIDPTDPFVPVGRLPASDQGRWALVAESGTTGLVRTPAATAEQNLWIERREFDLAELGAAGIREVSEYTGIWADSLRADYALGAKSELREVLEGYVDEEYLADSLADWSMSDPRDLSGPWRLELRANGARRGSTDQNEAAVALFPPHLLRGVPDLLSEESASDPRENAAEIDAFRIEWRYRIVPPPGFEARGLPEPVELSLGPARVWRSFELGEDGTVSAQMGFENPLRRWSAEQLGAYREALPALARTPAVLIQFDRLSARLRREGDIAGALREARRLVELHPREALHRIHVAEILLAVGFGEEARRESERAVEVEPESAPGARMLGWILQHDLWGRRFGPGYPRQRAIESYRRAIRLDPDDLVAIADLAILLEHDEKGRRYADPEALEEAADLYRSIVEKSDNHAFDANLAVDLFRLGRYDEIAALAAEKRAPPAIEIASVALRSDVATAVESARSRGWSDADRAQALAGAAQELIRMRRYAQAAELARHAAGETASAAQLTALTVLARTRRLEDLDLDPASPEDLVERLFRIFAEPSESAARLRGLLSRRALELEESDGPDELEGQLLDLVQGLEGSGIPLSAAVDVALSAVDTSIEGDADSGYRVRVSFSKGGPASQLDLYGIVEEGEIRILGVDDELEAIAELILAELDSGDLDSARTWLDRVVPGLSGGLNGNPLSGSAARRLWGPGRSRDEDAARRAAWSLLAGGRHPERAEEWLRGELETADESARPGLELALYRAVRELDDDEALLEVLDRIARRAPGTEAVARLRFGALQRLGRYGEAEALAQARLEADPGDEIALRALASLELRVDDVTAAAARLEQLERSGRASVEDLNELAWMGLFEPRLAEAAERRAERAARESDYRSYAILNTLAAVYAHRGRVVDAYRVWVQSLAIDRDREPAAPDLLVLGLLAESCGEDEIARSRYTAAIADSEEDEPVSSARLARLRLAALEANAPGATQEP